MFERSLCSANLSSDSSACPNILGGVVPGVHVSILVESTGIFVKRLSSSKEANIPSGFSIDFRANNKFK